MDSRGIVSRLANSWQQLKEKKKKGINKVLFWGGEIIKSVGEEYQLEEGKGISWLQGIRMGEGKQYYGAGKKEDLENGNGEEYQVEGNFTHPWNKTEKLLRDISKEGGREEQDRDCLQFL